MSDNVYRTLIKTFSWRFFATLDTMIIAYFITNNLAMAASIGVIEVFTKLLLYYIHERVWNKVVFGKIIIPITKIKI